MKKLLSIYLSLSLAIFPSLSKASQGSQQLSRAEGVMLDQIAEAQSLLASKGIRILQTSDSREVDLAKAMDGGDFILDASTANLGILRVKKVSLDKKGDLKLAVAELNSIQDRSSAETTLITLNLNKGEKYNVKNIYEALGETYFVRFMVILQGLFVVFLAYLIIKEPQPHGLSKKNKIPDYIFASIMGAGGVALIAIGVKSIEKKLTRERRKI